MSGFRDHFSSTSNRYAAYRPDYPAALFTWLASGSPGRATASDCATGSGQAAHGTDPLPTPKTELKPLWGKPAGVRYLAWPLFLRMGRAPAA